MANDNNTPIRPENVAQSVAAPNPTVEVIEKRAEEIRELIFQAQAIVHLAMRAAMADERNQDWSMKNALGCADGMLDQAAGMLEPDSITALSADREATHA